MALDNVKQRGDELLENIEAFPKNPIATSFSKVVVIESSYDVKEVEGLFKKVSSLSNPIEVLTHHAIFDETQKSQIQQKGKGFSELLMLHQAIRVLSLERCMILKLSGRYRPRCWKKIIQEFNFEKENKKESFLCISYSRIRRVALTYAFAAKGCVISDFAEKFLTKINDSKNIYVEHCLFQFAMMNKYSHIKRVHIYKYFFHITSGSTGLAPNYLKQILRLIIYRL